MLFPQLTLVCWFLAWSLEVQVCLWFYSSTQRAAVGSQLGSYTLVSLFNTVFRCHIWWFFFLFICVHVCVCEGVHIYECSCVCVWCVNVKVRDQLQVLSLRDIIHDIWDRDSYCNSPIRLGWLVNPPPPALASPVLGSHIHITSLPTRLSTVLCIEVRSLWLPHCHL